MNVKLDGRNKKKRYYYQCENHRRKTCTTKALNAQYLENAVLDTVIKVIKNTNFTTQFKAVLNEQLAFEKGILAKNQTQLKRCKTQLDSYVTKSSDPKTPPFLVSQYEQRIIEIARDIEKYTDNINKQQSKINELLTNTDFTITKNDLLNNRIIARSIIKEIVSEIIYDELNDEINIKLI